MTKELIPLDSVHGYNGPSPKQDNPREPKVLVRFNRPYPPWQTGEVAGFPESRAMVLVKPIPAKQGGPLAELYVPPENEMED